MSNTNASEISEQVLAGAPARQPMDIAERQALAALEQRLFGRKERVVVGRYELLDKIGAGGAGLVYAALDPQLRRKVAIKFVHRGSDPEASVRLVREARALARLTHPNIVRVYDVGTVDDPGHEDEHLYIVMELLEGESLRLWLERGHGWRTIVETLVAAGRGLAAAHERGWVHRDFKPGNVHVGSDGVVRVLDFGFARSSGSLSLSGLSELGSRDALDPVSRLTASGAVVGTLRYMSPEQRSGARELDGRADQYSFCLTLTEALSGAASPEGLAQLSWRVPSGIVRALRRGLSEDPSARWSSMDPLLDELVRAGRRRALSVALAGSLAGLTILALGWQLLSEGATADAVSSSDCDATPSFAQLWDAQTRSELERALLGTGHDYAETSAASTLAALDAYVARGDEQRASLCASARAESPCLTRAHQALEVVIELLSRPDPGRAEAAVALVRELPVATACAPQGARFDAKAERDLFELRAWRVLGELERAEHFGDLQRRALAPEQTRLRAHISFEMGLARLEAKRFGEAVEALEDAYFTALERGDDQLAIRASAALVRAAGRAGQGATRWRREGRAWLARAELDEGVRTQLQAELACAQLELDADAELPQALAPVLAQLADREPPPGIYAELVAVMILAELEGRAPAPELLAHAERVHAERESSLGLQHPATLRAGLGLGLLRHTRGEASASEQLSALIEGSAKPLGDAEPWLQRARAALHP